METKALLEMEKIQAELSNSIGMVFVIADGLSCYTHANALSGERAERYVNSLFAVYDTLAAMNEKFREQLNCVPLGTENEIKKESIA